MILELETLAKLTPACRKDVETYCALRNVSYPAILKAVESDKEQMGKVDALILHLSRRGYSLKDMHTAAGVSKNYALSVLEKAKLPDYRIRTTNWSRFATCRR